MFFLLLIVGLLATVACGSEPSVRQAKGAAGAFAAPEAWAFPGERVVTTYGSDGMVSTTDSVASEIGVEVLRRGGNAVDAAVAIQFALAVVNPEAGNIGGGGFMVVRMADGRTAALDFREKAPLAASRNMYVAATGTLTDRSVIGHLAAGVPASVAGMWEAHKRFASYSWSELIQPAINLADGLVIHERLARSLQTYEERLLRHTATAGTFLLNGQALRVGDRLQQHDLAETLRRIARDGAHDFYHGRTAELIVAEMQRGGGIITRQDLARYDAAWRDPITFQYRGHTIVTMSPPSSGGATLAEILNILEGYDVGALGHLSRDHVRLWTEAVRRAFADRNTYLADPDFVSQPTERMISDAYAAERRAEIGGDRATPSDQVRPGMGPVPAGHRPAARAESEHTTHFSVLDHDGNAVAVTTTLNSLYGSQVMVTGAGFLMNNEMDDFAASPGKPNQFGLVQGEANAIEPGKRMLSSMTPTIVLDPRGRVEIITGTPGGPTIVTTVAQIISNVIDFKMDIGNATAAPRLHHQHLPDVIYYERDGLRPDVESAVRALGYNLEARRGYQGDAQSILVRPDGTHAGIADPRLGGAAIAVREVRQVAR